MVDTSIPLRTRGVDFSQGIASLSNAIQQKKNNERLDRQEARQGEFDELQKTQILQQIEASNKTQSFTDMATDAIQVRSLLDAGDVEGARSFAIDRVSRLNERRKTDPSVNTVNTERFIQALEQDPKQASELLNQEISSLQQLGFIKGGAAVKPLTGIGKARSDLNNGLISQKDFDAEVAKTSGVKSPEELAQLVEFERLKTIAKRNEPEEKLKLEKLQQDVAAGKLKVAEGELQQKKAGTLKETASRLIDDLLKDPDSISAIVGPFDQSFLSPTLFGDALKAQTKVNQLKSVLTAENLGIMTGVLSETDLKVIADIAGGGLDVDGDQDAFLEELRRMKQSFGSGEAQSNAQQQTDSAPQVLRFDAQGNLIQ